MFEALLTFSDQLLHNLRIADVADILLAAVLIYCALLWFGETTSRRVLVGVTLLGLVYLAARMFEMHLMSLAFQTGFTVLLLLLIVLFQEDLRRMLSRAATWFTLAPRNSHASRGELEIVAETAFELAKQKTGALIVLPGSEPLERHLSGGVRLNGLISRELLHSIFDPSSEGHDGAIIVDNDCIQRFGVHLPISTNLGVIQGRGTRHSAAVGLTECSDAVVVVVSEERGAVSIAQAGRLQRVDSPAKLLNLLQESTPGDATNTSQRAWTRHLTAHWRLKVLAISMAMITWFVLAYDPSTVARTFNVSIDYRNLPEGLMLDRPMSQVQLTLSGSEANFRFIAPESLKFSVDLAEVEAGNHVVTLGEENIKLPTNLKIDSIDPDVIGLYLREAPKPKPPG